MFTVKRNCIYKDVSFRYNDTVIDMGLHSKEDRKALAEALLSTVFDLIYDDYETEELHEFVLEQM